MNYKSKKSIFNGEIVNKEELSLDTKRRLRDSKYLIMVLDVFMLCVNLFMLGYFISKGFDIIALSILSVIIAMDVIHLVLSGFLNYKFLSNIIFTSVYSLVLLILTAALFTISFFIFDGITIFENVSIVISILVRFVYFVATLVTMSLITKNKIKVIQPMVIIILAISLLGGTVFYGTMSGLYGKGSSLFDGNRTLEYRMHDANSVYDEAYYEVVGSLDSRYTNITIPDEFNGKKVRAVDYSVFLTEGLKTVGFQSKESVYISNSETGAAISSELDINMPKVMIDQFKQDIYNDVDNRNSNIVGLAGIVNPQLAKDEIAVKFNFDPENLPKDLLNEDESSYKFINTTYFSASDEFTLQSIMELNVDYSEYFKKNYLSENYEWNYAEMSKKAMLINTSLTDEKEKITENTTISISFEDVYKIDYNFAATEDDGFHDYAIYDLEVKADKYIISSDLSDIDFYDDVRDGSVVHWTIESGNDSASVDDAAGILDFVNSKDLKSDSTIVMQANWDMYDPLNTSLEMTSSGSSTENITYGDDLDVKFMHEGYYSNDTKFAQKFDWSITQGTDNEIASASWEYEHQLDDNIVFTQNQATGVTYNISNWNVDWYSQELLNATTSGEPIIITFTYAVTDAYWAEGLTANVVHTQELNIAPKELELEWKYDGDVITDTNESSFVYDTSVHTVGASIIQKGICFADKVIGEDVEVTIAKEDAEKEMMYSDDYSFNATLIGNPNYVIKNEGSISTMKIVTINPALINITYNVSAAGGEYESQEGLTSIGGLKYLGNTYNITPVFKILNESGQYITLEESDDITSSTLYEFDLADGEAIKNVRPYKISYDIDNMMSSDNEYGKPDMKKSYVFSEGKLTEQIFAISEAIITGDDITWDKQLVYSGQMQMYTGKFNLKGTDVSGDITNNIVHTQVATDAGTYVSSSITMQHASDFSNYELDENATKTFTIERKVVTNIASQSQTDAFNTSDYFVGFNATAVGVQNLPIKLEVLSATNVTAVSEFINAGTYSNLVVKLPDNAVSNYSFTKYDAGSDEVDDDGNLTYGYSSVKTSNLSFEIKKHKLLQSQLDLVEGKNYDAGTMPIPTKINSTTFNKDNISYAVDIKSFDGDTTSAGKNFGIVSYGVTMTANAGVTENYDPSTVENIEYSYRIDKRQVDLTVTSTNLRYNSEQIVFEYELDADNELCNKEISHNDFISMSTFNAVAADTYIIKDEHIAVNIDGKDYYKNYQLASNVGLTVYAFDISEQQINWDKSEDTYSGKEQGLTATFNPSTIFPTDNNTFIISGTKKKDVNRDGAGKVIPYTYNVNDMTYTNGNYKIYTMEDVTYTIMPKEINYVVPSDQSNYDSSNQTFEFVYSGSPNSLNLKHQDSETKQEIAIVTKFSGNEKSDFTNATVDAGNKVEAKELVMSESTGNFTIKTAITYKLRIDKEKINLVIDDKVEYNANNNYPKHTNSIVPTLKYNTVDHNINVGTDYKVEISFEKVEDEKNYALLGLVANDNNTIITHAYAITQAELDADDITYKATQDKDNITDESFETMIGLDKMEFNGESWFIVARVSKTWDTVVQSAFIYTGELQTTNYTATNYNVDVYNVSIASGAIEVYGLNNFTSTNYNLTNALSQDFRISQHIVIDTDIVVSLDGLAYSTSETYSGVSRVLAAGFTPVVGEGLIMMDSIKISSLLNYTEIMNADSYTLTFKYDSTLGNYNFGDNLTTYPVVINKKEINASINAVDWSDATTQVYDNTLKTFKGTITVGDKEVSIVSNTEYFVAKNAADYGSGAYINEKAFTLYTDSVINNNYILTGVDQVFTINKATIIVDDIEWTSNGTVVSVAEGLTVTYNKNVDPDIKATYTGFSSEVVDIIVSPETTDTTYNAYSNGVEQSYKFFAKSDDSNYYIDLDEEKTGITVKIARLEIADGSSLIWALPGVIETDPVNGRSAVQYTGGLIKPTVNIYGDALALVVNELVDELYYTNANDDAIVVEVAALQDNYSITSNREYSYYIIKQKISADSVKFADSVNAQGERYEFTYSGGYVITDAYVTTDSQTFKLTVTGDHTNVNVNVDPYKVNVSLSTEPNYEVDSVELDYYIIPLEKDYVWDVTSRAFTGKTLTPSIEGVRNLPVGLQVKIGGNYVAVVKHDNDGVIVVDDYYLVNAGTYELKYVASDVADGNYSYTNDTATFIIDRMDISNMPTIFMSISATSADYNNGDSVTLPVLVFTMSGTERKIAGALIFKMKDVVVSEPKAIGKYSVTIKCPETGGNFKGEHGKKLSFTIR